MTRDHAAALALLDKITPKHWGLWSGEGGDRISVCAQDKRPVNGWLDPMQDEGHECVAMVHGEANARAIAALPELAEAWRKGLAYREAEHDYVAAVEAEDADYDPLKVGDMRARLHAAAAAFDDALAAVAEKLTGEGK